MTGVPLAFAQLYIATSVNVSNTFYMLDGHRKKGT